MKPFRFIIFRLWNINALLVVILSTLLLLCWLFNGYDTRLFLVTKYLCNSLFILTVPNLLFRFRKEDY